MQGAPYFFDDLNQFDSRVVPGTMKRGFDALSQYCRRYLAQKAFAIYKWDNLPEWWDEEYLQFTLMIYGIAAVFNTDKFGVIPQSCGIGGYNVFYRPTRAIVANPLFDKTYELKIGTDCELIRFSPLWRGIPDLIGHYADLWALTITSIVCNLYNSRLSYVFTSGNKSIAESFKAMFDQIGAGNPAVFADKNLFTETGEPNWQAFQQDLKGTYIIDLLQAAERDIISQFYSEIGIPNLPYEKGERLITAEATTHEYATECLADLWRRTMNATAERVNKMFGLNISVDFNDALKGGGANVRTADNRGADEI